MIAAEDIPERFAELVRAQAYEQNASIKKVIHNFSPIQSAVIRVMNSMGDNYVPFEAQTMELYVTVIKQAGIEESDIKVGAHDVQQALIASQDKKLVWKASGGAYGVDEQVILDVLRAEGQLERL